MSPEERKELISEIICAIGLVNPPLLSEDETRWVKMAIQREAQSIELRKAIIEKTITGLIWAAIVGCGYILLDFLKSHGFNV